MINRRQRLEFALSILPYDHKLVQLSPAQQKVENIIARLRIDESTNCSSHEPENDDEKARQQEQKANGFAELALRHIEESDREPQAANPKPKLSTLATLTLAAEKLLRTTYKQEDEEQEEEEEQHETNRFDDDSDLVLDEEEALARVDRRQLLDNNIQALNEARLKLLQSWEVSKRKALDLLTVEIEKVQNMDQVEPQKSPKSPQFGQFSEGTDELNTSTPKTNEEDDENGNANANEAEAGDDEEKENEAIQIDPDDEEYVPYSSENPNKRKRAKKALVTSTPLNAKRTCPTFEFDHDGKSKMVIIGPNGTKISRACLEAINWNSSGPSITRKLLCEIFDRATLAFHTLSGKPSPAFKDCARPTKQQLDPLKVTDLVFLMTNSLQMTPREVRTAITTKCADENKMLRTRQQRPRKTI